MSEEPGFLVIRITHRPFSRKLHTADDALTRAAELNEQNTQMHTRYGVLHVSAMPLCSAVVHHGPGRQSRTECENPEPNHEYHYARGPAGEDWEWKRAAAWVDDWGQLYRESDA